MAADRTTCLGCAFPIPWRRGEATSPPSGRRRLTLCQLVCLEVGRAQAAVAACGPMRPAFKGAMAELVTDCVVPIRDMPKVFVVMWTAIHGAPPPVEAILGLAALKAQESEGGTGTGWRARKKAELGESNFRRSRPKPRP